MARAYVPIYFEWREPIALLSDAECGRLLRSLLEYGETGATKELGGNEKFLFALMKQKIDRDAQSYEDKCQRLAENRQSANKSDSRKTNQLYFKTNQTDNKQIKQTPNKSDVTITKTITKTKTISNNPLTPFEGELSGYSKELFEAINDWIAYKAEKRQSYKPTGLKSLVTQIKNAANQYGEQAVIKVIKDSMAANYQGIVFDRLKQHKNQSVTKPRQIMGNAEQSVTYGDIQKMKDLIQSMKDAE